MARRPAVDATQSTLRATQRHAHPLLVVVANVERGPLNGT
jgi:hypothetical protein